MPARRLLLTIRINTYMAMLILALCASAATLAIVRVSSAQYTEANLRADEAQYLELKESILKAR